MVNHFTSIGVLLVYISNESIENLTIENENL